MTIHKMALLQIFISVFANNNSHQNAVHSDTCQDRQKSSLAEH